MLVELRAAHEEHIESGREMRRLRDELREVRLSMAEQTDELRGQRAQLDELHMAARTRKEMLHHTVHDQSARLRDLEDQLEERQRRARRRARANRGHRGERPRRTCGSEVQRLERAQADLEKVRALMQAFAFGNDRLG